MLKVYKDLKWWENKNKKLGKLTVHLQLGNLFDQWRKLGENTSQAAARKYKMYFDIIGTQCYLLYQYAWNITSYPYIVMIHYKKKTLALLGYKRWIR